MKVAIQASNFVKNERQSALQKTARILLGCFMVLAGIGHLTFQRKEFRAQVPNWLPVGKDLTVVVSGMVEIALGLALIFWLKKRKQSGIALAHLLCACISWQYCTILKPYQCLRFRYR